MPCAPSTSTIRSIWASTCRATWWDACSPPWPPPIGIGCAKWSATASTRSAPWWTSSSSRCAPTWASPPCNVSCGCGARSPPTPTSCLSSIGETTCSANWPSPLCCCTNPPPWWARWWSRIPSPLIPKTTTRQRPVPSSGMICFPPPWWMPRASWWAASPSRRSWMWSMRRATPICAAWGGSARRRMCSHRSPRRWRPAGPGSPSTSAPPSWRRGWSACSSTPSRNWWRWRPWCPSSPGSAATQATRPSPW